MKPKTQRYRRRILLPAVIGVSIALLAAGVATATSNGGLTAPSADDIAAANSPFEDGSEPSGTALAARGEVGGAGAIEPADRPISLAPEVSGVVAEIAVSEGDLVVEGQLLLRLRDATATAELAAAVADTAAARSDASAARADAKAASARAESTRGTAGRTVALAGQGAATPDELSRAERARDADAAAADAANARAAQAGARIRSAEAREAVAQARLAQLEVRSPIAGEVLEIMVRPGEAASPQATLAVVGDTRTLRARLDVNERDAVHVRPGQVARVRVEGGAADLTGRVVTVARRVGRKNVDTDDATDRQDARFVETVIELDAAPQLPVGIRVQGYITLDPATGSTGP